MKNPCSFLAGELGLLLGLLQISSSLAVSVQECPGFWLVSAGAVSKRGYCWQCGSGIVDRC